MKTFSAATTSFTNIISVGSTSTFNDTASFNKSNGRAIEVKTGSALNGYWTGSGDITCKSFKQNGSTATNSFTGNITTSGSLIVSGDSTLGNNSNDRVYIKGYISTSVSPSSSSYTLGASTQPWGGIYTAKNVDWGLSGGQFAGRLNQDGSMQLKNMTGTSQLGESPAIGMIAMFNGVLYYYGTGNQCYMFAVGNNQPPS